MINLLAPPPPFPLQLATVLEVEPVLIEHDRDHRIECWLKITNRVDPASTEN